MLEFLMLLEFLKNILNQPANVFNDNLNNINTLYKSENFVEIKNFKIDPNQISAQNVLIKEIKGPILYQKNAQEQKTIASLTKLMTSLVALNIYSPTEKFEIQKDYPEKQTEFKKGEAFYLNDLLKTLLIASSNSAAEIIQDKIGKKEFIKYMNKMAETLNLNQTIFEDAIGISSNNKSSLNDLYNLSEFIIKNKPEIFKYSREASFVLKGEIIRYIYNTNKLIEKYPSIIFGSKTGYTEDAGQCLIMILKFEKSPLIFVGLLNSKNREADGDYIIKTLKEYYHK
mgnify:CR=1 FL=1